MTDRSRLLNARELLVEVVIIVMAVVIALSFEGAREWWNDRSLVAEARRNIGQELADNKAEIDKMPAAYARVRRELELAADAARMVLDTRKGPGSLALRFEFAELSRVSRTTAELTGALGLMDYDEVRRYESVYQLQQMFSDTERRCYEGFLSVISSVRLAAEPASATTPELMEWNREIHLARSTVDVLEQLAKRLSDSYTQVLQAR